MNNLTWLSSSWVGYMMSGDVTPDLLILRILFHVSPNLIPTCFLPRGQPCFLFQRKFTILQENILYIPLPLLSLHMSMCPGVHLAGKACFSAYWLQVSADSQVFLQFLGLSSESLMLILSGWLSFMLNMVFCKLKPWSHFWALSNCLPLSPCVFSFFFNILHGFPRDLPGLQRPCAKPSILSFSPRLCACLLCPSFSLTCAHHTSLCMECPNSKIQLLECLFCSYSLPRWS